MLKSDFKAFEGLKRVNIVILRLKTRVNINFKAQIKCRHQEMAQNQVSNLENSLKNKTQE